MSLPPDLPDPFAAPRPADPQGRDHAPRRRLLRRPLVAIVAAAVLVGGGAAVATAQNQSPGPAELPALDAPTPVSEPEPEPAPDPSSTTTTVVASPSTQPVPAAPERTRPQAPPAERAKGALVKVGEIRIPKIGLVHPVYEGVTLTVVDHGPGHWPGSAMPGELGNAVFAGHRVTHSHPFRRLHELAPGDPIVFVTAAGEFTYQVTGQEIVNPTDTWIVDPTDDATVTLFACHPPGSAKQRIVVRGSFRASAPLPAPAPA